MGINRRYGLSNRKNVLAVSGLILIMGVASILSGCSSVKMSAEDIKTAFQGREAIIRSFDEESNVIDRVQGKSVSITRNAKFDSEDSDGFSNKDSSVISITVGGEPMTHVGSSLIMADAGLTDLFEIYSKNVDITNTDRNVPVVSRMLNNIKNYTTGMDKLLLIRSQNGTPLATFAGKEVSEFASSIPKTTIFMIDGMILVVYRCDYTTYSLKLLNEQPVYSVRGE